MRSRRFACGFTLIEIVAMLSLLTAVITASLSLLSHLTEISKKTTGQNLSIGETRRFVDQFRSDVHRCNVAVTHDDGKSLLVTDDKGMESEFRFFRDGVSYVSNLGEPARRDLFRIDTRNEAMFIIETSNRLVRAHLRSQDRGRQEWLVDAMMKAAE